MNARLEVAIAIGMMLIVHIGALSAQDADDVAELKLFQQQPFDELTLKEASGGGTYKVRPIPFPDRKIPDAPSPDAILKVHLLENDTQAEIFWRDIARVRLFEQMVLAEADALVAAKEFDQAYDYFDFLLTRYPDLPGLEAAVQRYWYRNAGALFQEGELTGALALLDQLHETNAEYPGLATALASVTDRLMRGYMEAKDYPAARRLLEQTARRSGDDTQSVTTWRQTLRKAAEDQLVVAREHFSAKAFRDARTAAGLAHEIWPENKDAADLLGQIDAVYPLVIVSVGQPADVVTSVPQLHPALLRRKELTTSPLVRLSHYTARGPEHVSDWGELKLASDRTWVELNLPVSSPTRRTGYDVMALLRKSNDGFQADSLISAAQVSDVYSIRLDFNRGHVSPLSWLAGKSSTFDATGRSLAGDYRYAEDAAGARFVLADANNAPAANASAAQPREVIEIFQTHAHEEIDHLLRGKIDVIARVDPASISQLEGGPGITVNSYALPTVHLLLPNARRPLPANRTFRRAVMYGLDRESILRNELLGGKSPSDCQTISAPCPVSDDEDDYWAYGYDRDIDPLAYEPALALTLNRVARSEVAEIAAQRAEINVSSQLEQPIVIGHENNWLHAVAAQAIVDALNRLEIAAVRLELASSEDLDQCDFVYAELLLREPLVDLPTLLESDNLPEAGHLSLALDGLAKTTNWRDATDRMYDIHAIVHAEQTLLPLWQITHRYAYRNRLNGVADRPITLYQQVRNWKVETQDMDDGHREERRQP